MPRTRTPLYIALRKHKEALASIEVHRRWIVKLEDRVSDLERAIEDLGGFPQPKRSRLDFSARGIMQKTLYDLLRTRGEVTVGELAATVMAEHVPPPRAPSELKALRQRSYQCIRRNAARGTVRHVGGAGKFKRYVLAALTTQ